VTDPLTWAALGATALTEGIKFLYNQASELLKRRAERKNAVANGEPTPPLTVPVVEDKILAGKLKPAAVNESILDEYGATINTLRKTLSDYVDGIEAVDPEDPALVAQVESLRDLLEMAYGQKITFEGEKGEPTGSSVNVKVMAQRVDGKLTVAKVKHVGDGGHVDAIGHFGTVGQNAEVTGYEGESVGG